MTVNPQAKNVLLNIFHLIVNLSKRAPQLSNISIICIQSTNSFTVHFQKKGRFMNQRNGYISDEDGIRSYI